MVFSAAHLVFGTGMWRQPQDWLHSHMTDPRDAARSLEAAYGIEVRQCPNAQVLPVEWRAAPFEGEAVPAARSDLGRALRAVREALEHYPGGLPAANLAALYICGGLSFFGVRYGGTYHGDIVYLVAGSRFEGFDEHELQRAFHHEFSSVLFHGYGFPVETWAAANLSSFSYMPDFSQLLQAVEAGDDRFGDAALLEEGFLSAYGQTTLENDFNTFAEAAFTSPNLLRHHVEAYPRVREKFKIFKDFYLSIDPGFERLFSTIFVDG